MVGVIRIEYPKVKVGDRPGVRQPQLGLHSRAWLGGDGPSSRPAPSGCPVRTGTPTVSATLDQVRSRGSMLDGGSQPRGAFVVRPPQRPRANRLPYGVSIRNVIDTRLGVLPATVKLP